MKVRILHYIACFMAITGGTAAAAGPIVKPSVPGAASTRITTEESRKLADAPVVPADIAFMQDMIVHHSQAVEMVGLIETRSTSPDIARLGKRIAKTQTLEIGFMKSWLQAHGFPLENEHAHHHMTMNGMLTDAQMSALRASKGKAFDRLFLVGMIQHHGGAIDMVRKLVANEGADEESELNYFVNGITPDQSAQIARMQNMLAKR